MAKRFKDLGKSEIYKICARQKKCRNCPLVIVNGACLRDFTTHKDFLSDKILDKVVIEGVIYDRHWGI